MQKFCQKSRKKKQCTKYVTMTLGDYMQQLICEKIMKLSNKGIAEKPEYWCTMCALLFPPLKKWKKGMLWRIQNFIFVQVVPTPRCLDFDIFRKKKLFSLSWNIFPHVSTSHRMWNFGKFFFSQSLYCKMKILIKLHALSYSGFSSKMIFVLLKKLKKPFRGLVNLANEFWVML